MATPYFLAESQFIGEIQLDFGDFNKFDDFATQSEKHYLIRLLGWQLYKALIDDLDGNNDPQTQKYINLVDGIEAGYVGTDGIYYELAGIKAMLPYFFYCDYIKDVQGHNTETGDVQTSVTNSVESVGNRNDRIIKAWTKGRCYYYQLVDYIGLQNSEQGEDYYENWFYSEMGSINFASI